MTHPLLDLSGVTLVCVDNRTPALALQALQRCRAQARFARTVLFTDAATAAGPLPDGIEALPVAIRSVPEYSQFMLRGLLPHVQTPHLLVVQWDGFLLDAAQWTPEFLDCDYIGALLRNEPSHRSVGNGGFSLRSRRLLVALEDARITPTHPEDTCICQDHRALLEQAHGIRFAPPALAARFAYERVPSTGATFGFHGMFNLHRALSPSALHDLLDALPDGMFVGMDARDLCRALLQDRRLDDAARVLERRLRAGQHDRRTRQLQVKLAALRVARRVGWSA